MWALASGRNASVGEISSAAERACVGLVLLLRRPDTSGETVPFAAAAGAGAFARVWLRIDLDLGLAEHGCVER